MTYIALAFTALVAFTAGTPTKDPSPTLAVRPSAYGPILFDGRGHALYAFTRDARGGRSTCYGACAKAWPTSAGPPTAKRPCSPSAATRRAEPGSRKPRRKRRGFLGSASTSVVEPALSRWW